MAGFNDATLGSQRIGFAQGGVKMEMCLIDYSNDISADNTIPTTLQNLLGWVGYATICEDAAASVCGGIGKPITAMSLCDGGYLGISAADVTVGTATSRGRLNYLVWGW